MRRDRIRRERVIVARVLLRGAVTLAVIALAPVIVLVGEPLRRYYLRRLRRWSQPHGVGWRRRRLARLIFTNPVLIALTAPGRWVMDRVSVLGSGGSSQRGFGRFGRRGGPGGDWPPPAEMREPRRPKPTAPAGSIALAEPRHQHRAVRIRKALPPALSEPVRRAGSHLDRMAGILRARIRRWLSHMRYRRRGLRASGS